MEKKRIRRGAGVLAVCMVSVITAMTVWAESRIRITGPIQVYVNSSISAGTDHGSVNVSVTGGHCSYEDVEILNEPDQWAGGDVPRIRVTISAESGYYFSSLSKSMFEISGNQNPRYSSTSVEGGSDKTTLRLTIKLDELDTDRDSLTVDNIGWNGDSGVGEWSDSNQARSYQVKLRRDDRDIGSVYSTTNTSYDFANQITRRGDYTFCVRIVDYNGNKGYWEESDSFYVDSRMADDFSDGNYYHDSNSSSYGGPGNTSSGGQWIQDSTGWWFRNANGSYTKSNWQYINNYWYFFDARGYMMTGWINWQNKWYYCDTGTGAMWHDATTPDGYQVDSSGVWRPSAYTSNANKGPGTAGNGATNTGGPGTGSTGGQWVQDANGWQYRNSDGSVTKNNWQLINHFWYFFNSQGYMQTGWIAWNGKWYYCDTSMGGMWVSNTTPDGFRVDATGARY